MANPTRTRGIACKVCDVGTMTHRKKYRMSGVVVFIGYVLLVPSALGALVGFVSIGVAASATVEASGLRDAPATERMQRIDEPPQEGRGAPAATDGGIRRLRRGDHPSDDGLAYMDVERRLALQNADLGDSLLERGTAAALGTVASASFGVLMVIGSILGGLLGWLLVMKKKVLQCAHCEAVVAAS